MRRVMGVCVVLLVLLSMCGVGSAADQKQAASAASSSDSSGASSSAGGGTSRGGGVAAFFIGCFYGPRVGLQWNEGIDLHWREWCHIVPGINVWNAIECAQGLTGHEWAQKNGVKWY